MTGRPLRLVDPAERAPSTSPAPSPSRVVLPMWKRIEVEAARAFLDQLGEEMTDPSPVRLAYLIGCLEGHAHNLLDVLASVTEVR